MMETIQRSSTSNRKPWQLLMLMAYAVVMSSSPTAAANNQYGYYNSANYYNNDDGNNDDGNNAGDDAYYNQGDDSNNDDGFQYNNYNNQNYNNLDDYYKQQNGNGGDDDYANMNSQYYNNNNQDDTSNSNFDYGQYQDDWAENNMNVADDDLFHWSDNLGFDGVSVMPVSCVNYNNGHMIKFEFFETENSHQCHFSSIGTFVVSIAHYMRAYFNYQALANGQDFELPSDAGYLNCVAVQETAYSNEPLYAKIGCVERETFTSTKLALHLYTDASCSNPYDDGYPTRRHSSKGYVVDGYTFSSRVSFRPPFYTCQTCDPEEVSETFNKHSGTWYDDDYISEHGERQEQDDENNGNNNQDDLYVDDAYLVANDDVNYNNRMLAEIEALSKEGESGLEPVDESIRTLTAAEGQLEAYEKEFWESVEEQKRSLYENNYDINGWNMCQRVYKYGLWCDEDCRSLDAFRTDRWSGADIILLSIMVSFSTCMMLLIVAKRLKAAQRATLYQDESSMPGLPPVAMLVIFMVIIFIIVILAKLKFVNETLVFAVAICLLLFIYMLKLTLFGTKRPKLLSTARHDLFDSRMDERLFD